MLFFSLIPLAYAKKKPGILGRAGQVNRATDTAQKRNMEQGHRLGGEQISPQNREGNLFTVGSEKPVPSELEANRVFSELGATNGDKKSIQQVLLVPTASNANITRAINEYLALVNPFLSKDTVRQLLVNIGNTSRTAPSAGKSAGNVVRAVTNHIAQVNTWAKQPQIRYQTFIQTLNRAKADPTVGTIGEAVRRAVQETFGLRTKKAIRAKRAEIEEYCRV